jgi:dienelactone hydrolase
MAGPRGIDGRRAAWTLLALLVFALAGAARAQERVNFPSLDGRLSLTAYLDLPARAAPGPAVVMLHGCSGLGSGKGPFKLYRAWRDFLIAKGYVALMVDSAASRGLGQTCTNVDEGRRMMGERAADAYAALAFLAARADVSADRIALIGWSQGGGVVLSSIAAGSRARPNPPPAHDFAAAVAFYPGACSDRLQSAPFVDAPPDSWTTAIPLLVLQGASDNWTPAKSCAAFLGAAEARHAPVTLQIYPGAYHSFDLADTPIHTVERYRRGDWAPIEGTNEAARADALTRVEAFLAEHLGRSGAQ